jgi:soluble lytic murein transglycosylase-like protein
MADFERTITGLGLPRPTAEWIPTRKSAEPIALPGADGPARARPGAARATSAGNDDPVQAQKLRRATERFEALFIEEMLKAMDETPDGNVFFGRSSGGEIYRSMVETALSDRLAEGGALGIAETLYRELAPSMGLSVPEAAPSRSPVTGVPSGGHAATPRAEATSRPRVAEAAASAAHAYRALAAAAPLDDPAPSEGTNEVNGSGPAPTWYRRIARHMSVVQDAARTSGVSDSLVAAVLSVESDGDPRAVSPRGARGLMQLMPATAAALGVRDPHDPRENVDGGARYLRALIDRYRGDLALALAAYNAGPSRVDAARGVPEITETKNYVARVLERSRWLDDARTAGVEPRPGGPR